MDKGALIAKPTSVFFFSEEEKRSFCLNRVKPLRSPQPELLYKSILFFRETISFSEREHPFIDKLMFITKPDVARTPP